MSKRYRALHGKFFKTVSGICRFYISMFLRLNISNWVNLSDSTKRTSEKVSAMMANVARVPWFYSIRAPKFPSGRKCQNNCVHVYLLIFVVCFQSISKSRRMGIGFKNQDSSENAKRSF